MKVCKDCKKEKQLSEYYKKEGNKDGLRGDCIPCFKEKSNSRLRTKEGLILQSYRSQKSSSKRRGHEEPAYTKDEYFEWCMEHEGLNELYDSWVESGYSHYSKPSVDRLDDYKNYSFENIQWVTWRENKDKGFSHRVEGINNKTNKAVQKLSLEGSLIEEYHSIWQAERATGISNGNIGRVCSGKAKTAGGFSWKYK